MIPCLNLIYSFFQIELSPWQPFSSTRSRCYFSRCSFSRCSPCLPFKSQLSLGSAGMEFRLKVNVVSDMKMTEIQIIFSAFRIINKLKTETIFSFPAMEIFRNSLSKKVPRCLDDFLYENSGVN
jgi:hypothetical protein